MISNIDMAKLYYL